MLVGVEDATAPAFRREGRNQRHFTVVTCIPIHSFYLITYLEKVKVFLNFSAAQQGHPVVAYAQPQSA